MSAGIGEPGGAAGPSIALGRGTAVGRGCAGIAGAAGATGAAGAAGAAGAVVIIAGGAGNGNRLIAAQKKEKMSILHRPPMNINCGVMDGIYYVDDGNCGADDGDDGDGGDDDDEG